MKYFRLLTQIPCLLMMIAFCLTSCDKYNYTNDLQGLGSRVEELEKKTLEAGEQLRLLNEIILAIQNNGYIKEVINNGDGTYNIKFIVNDKESTYTLRDGRVGKDGKDGKSSTLDMGVDQDPTDGKWYWTLNGKWLLDDKGNKMPAGAEDGKNGKDGKDGKDGSTATAVLPQVRINKNRYWEISTDGGRTWKDTGVYADGKDGADGADGKDGKDGKDGADAADDMFLGINESADGKSITFIMRDGRQFTVPVM